MTIVTTTMFTPNRVSSEHGRPFNGNSIQGGRQFEVLNGGKKIVKIDHHDFMMQAVESYVIEKQVNTNESRTDILLKLKINPEKDCRDLYKHLTTDENRVITKGDTTYSEYRDFLYHISEIAIRHLFVKQIIQAKRTSFEQSKFGDETWISPWNHGELRGRASSEMTHKCKFMNKTGVLEIYLNVHNLKNTEDSVHVAMEQLLPGKQLNSALRF